MKHLLSSGVLAALPASAIHDRLAIVHDSPSMINRVLATTIVFAHLGVARAEDVADLPSSPSVVPTLYATGFAFAEGPALDAQGNLYVVNYRNIGTIGCIRSDGTAEIICTLDEAAPVDGRSSRANGLKIDRSGRLVVADSGAGRLLRINVDSAKAEVLADRWEGNRFQSINDVALDLAGNIYFSDPGNSSDAEPTGAVYRYDIVTKKTQQLETELAYPNGLAVTPDQTRLVVAESSRFRLLEYDLLPTGTVTNRRVLIEFPREDVEGLRGGDFEPDGMVFDSQSRLYVAMWTGGMINVVDIDTGQLVRQYDAGGTAATNCHFHGGFLYTTVASKEAVFRLDLGVDGFVYSEAP